MKPDSAKEQKPKAGRGPTRYAGICKAAAEFGVSRQHLFEVARGTRRSPLLARWEEFKARKRKAARRKPS